MATAAVCLVVLLSLMRSGTSAANCVQEQFFGSSTTPICGSDSDEVLGCSPNEIPITDGENGDTSDGMNSSEFLAWNESSGIIIVRSGGTDTLANMRQLNLYFYHEPSAGIGLPELIVSASTSDTTPGAPLNYTFHNNQDLSVDDAQIRHITLALTEFITVPANRFYIEFYTSDIQQFAISEVQLCADVANIDPETITLELTSEPLDGPAILLPANRTGLNENSILTLSCTVTIQGRFQWEWDSSIPVTPQVSDDTRISTIEIPMDEGSEGEYTCTAMYHDGTGLNAPPTTKTFTVGLEQLLIPYKTLIDITDMEFVQLQCTVVGYVSGSISTDFITWSFNGQTIRRTDKYTPSVSLDNCPPYGACGVGLLQIMDLNIDDVGEYVCSHGNLSQTITLLHGPVPSLIQSPTVVTKTEDSNSSSQTALIVGLVTAGCMVVLIIMFIIVLALCLMLRKKQKSLMAIEQSFYDYIDPSQPPTLPDRRIMLKENDAYGTHVQTETARTQTTPLRSNIAYGVVQPMEIVPTQTTSLQSNIAYGVAQPMEIVPTQTTSLQSNIAYGVAQPMEIVPTQTTSLQSNIAYGVAQPMEIVPTQTTSLQSNIAYGVAQPMEIVPTQTTPLQSTA